MAIKILKTTKTPTSRKPAAKKATKPVRPPRAIHKRVLLHPFTVMVLLCAGVIICGSTFHSTAASYDVMASVPATPVTSPAVITQPSDTEHLTTRTITVAGTCPAATYVKLYRNAVFMGVAQCSNQSFQIQANLLPGTNSMQAKVYNVTNDEGPSSPAVTLYYDETIQQQPQSSPSNVPTTIWVENVEQTGYHDGLVGSTSTRPTISGYAPPFSDITVTFHSDPVNCRTQADDKGWWTCTLQQSLPEGTHHVEIMAKTPSGEELKIPIFEILVKLVWPLS